MTEIKGWEDFWFVIKNEPEKNDHPVSEDVFNFAFGFVEYKCFSLRPTIDC